MTWTKRGRIFEPTGQADWVGTHAALPAVLPLAGRDRVYCSSRDAAGRSHIGFFEMAPEAPHQLLAISPAPVLSPGALGTFDDAGVTTSCVLAHDGRLYLYYTGWTLGVSVPFYLNAGVALSEDEGQTFTRVSPGPLLDRNAVDPYLTASPWVMIDSGRWRMWYVSGTGWCSTPAGPRHRYHIRYAESSDGRLWRRDGVVCIDYASPDEYAFGRPCVMRDGDTYRMWYSYRGDRYRIGYAESSDGLVWQRLDTAAGVDASPSGWDAEMVTYPVVTSSGSGLRMLYNGNDYGRTGIGLATTTS